MSLRETLSNHWGRLQGKLFPDMEEALGALSEKHIKLATVLETAYLERFFRYRHGVVGRPGAERVALARAFVAKAVFNLPSTSLLIDLLKSDRRLGRICGYERARDVPSESTFSRAFAEFAAGETPARVHEALIKDTLSKQLVGHISRDSTAIEAREKPAQKPQAKPQKQAKKRGRRKKGEAAPAAVPTRIETQRNQSLAAMLAALPTACDVGCKRNAKGHQESWIGYKLHIDTADGDIPVSAILTSASLHDSQAAIPLATITATRVENLYDLMDSAYDVPAISEHAASLGHVAIIDKNPRRDAALKEEIEREAKARRVIHMPLAEDIRYRQRSSAERVNSQLKDNFGGSSIRVRGHAKVAACLMFGLLSLTALQLMRLVA